MARNTSTSAEKAASMPVRETRMATIAQDSTDGADATGGVDGRSFRVRWTTGQSVKRWAWDGTPFMEELSVDPDSIDMSRANSGMPFLRDHDMDSVDSVLGKVERMWIEGGEGWATVRMSSRPEVAGIISDMKDGILASVSVGYSIDADKMIDNGPNQIPTRQVTRWTPLELSLVSVPADQDAGLRSAAADTPPLMEHKDMSNEIETRAAEVAPAQIIDVEAVKRAAAEEAARAIQARVAGVNAEIRSHVKLANLDSAFADRLIDSGMDADAARAAIFKELEKEDAATATRSAGSNVRVVHDEAETRRAAMVDGIIAKAGGTVSLNEVSRGFANMSLLDMCKESLAAEGMRRADINRMSSISIVQRALAPNTSSDFTSVTLNSIHKSLRNAYDIKAQTWIPLAQTRDVTDFRQVASVGFGNFGSLAVVPEGGKFEAISGPTDSRELYSLEKRGARWTLSWEAILADDLSAFTRIPANLGVAAASTESDIFYGFNGAVAVGTNGLTLNPLMADGNALFSAAHSNLIQTAAAISVGSVAAAEKLLLKQTAMNGTTFINVPAKYIVAGTDRKLEVDQLLGRIDPIQTSAVNPYSSLIPILDPRLNGVGGAPSPWYLATDPGQVPIYEVAYLAGERGPVVESKLGWETDGVEFKIRNTFQAKALDWRGMVMTPGA